MRRFLPLAAVLLPLVGSWAAEAVAAPVPKDSPLPSIDGKYTLVSVSSAPVERVAKGAKGNPGFAPSPRSLSTALVGPATITKKEIVLEGRAAALSPASAAQAAFLAAAGPTTMEYTLDPTKTPMTIDVFTANLRGKKTQALGVAEIIDNRLIIAVAQDGGDRPKTTDEAEGVTVYYFQKAPPPPRTEFRIVAMTVGKEAEAEKELNRLAADGYELVTTTTPAAVNDKASPTTVHFVLKRTVKQP